MSNHRTEWYWDSAKIMIIIVVMLEYLVYAKIVLSRQTCIPFQASQMLFSVIIIQYRVP